MNRIIEEIYKTRRVRDEAGNEHPLESHIDAAEGEFLADVVAQDGSVRKTLEVGCAHGLSSLFICTALAGRAGAKHVIVDPNEHAQYKGIGIANLKRAGIDFFELVEERSEFALPRLAREREGEFDLVFIDGWHTFDHTLLDLFYANRLIRVGGYIVVDDCTWAPVSKAVAYVAQYPAYQFWGQTSWENVSRKRRLAHALTGLVPQALWDYVLPKKAHDLFCRFRYSSMTALKKTAEDNRHWNWFTSF